MSSSQIQHFGALHEKFSTLNNVLNTKKIIIKIKKCRYILSKNKTSANQNQRTAYSFFPVTVTAVVKRWRNIRDQWLKWKNKHQNPLRYNPTSRAYRRKYLYHDQLKFLEGAMENNFDHTEMSQDEFFDHLTMNESVGDQPPLLRIKSSASTESLRSSETGHDASEPEINRDDYFAESDFLPDTENPLLIKKRKLSSDPGSQSEDDRHMMFFRSVIPYLKTFSERQILDFQMGVLQLVKTSMEPNTFPQI